MGSANSSGACENVIVAAVKHQSEIGRRNRIAHLQPAHMHQLGGKRARRQIAEEFCIAGPLENIADSHTRKKPGLLLHEDIDRVYYVTRGHRQPGIVLVGDAFATSCPAAGTGAFKPITDVQRLCQMHVPRWLATPGMDEDKIASFYDDDVKRKCDEYCFNKAFFLRSLCVDPGLGWRARRGARFVAHRGMGALRAAAEAILPASPAPLGAPARNEPSPEADSPPLIPTPALHEEKRDCSFRADERVTNIS